MAFSELIAIYLFLGGAAAGAFALMSVADLWVAFCCARDRRRHIPNRYSAGPAAIAWHRIVRLVYGAAFAMMAAALLCLLADLGRPEAFYLLFTNPSGSLMSLGTFALTLLSLCMGLVLAWEGLTLGPGWRRAARVAQGVGILFAFVVMVYTGLLLQTAVAVPLWQSGWLWVLFLFSSLSCGCAVIMLCTCASEGYYRIGLIRRRALGLDAVFILLEAASAAAFIFTLGSDGPTQPLQVLAASGFAALFWLGFVGCGILIPLAIEALLLIGRRHPGSTVAATLAVLVLAGGLCLRLVMIGAGVTPAI